MHRKYPPDRRASGREKRTKELLRLAQLAHTRLTSEGTFPVSLAVSPTVSLVVSPTVSLVVSPTVSLTVSLAVSVSVSLELRRLAQLVHARLASQGIFPV